MDEKEYIEQDGADARWRNESKLIKEQKNNDPQLFQQKNKRNIALLFIIPSFSIMMLMVIAVVIQSFREGESISNYLEFFLAISGMLNAAFGFILAHYFRKE